MATTLYLPLKKAWAMRKRWSITRDMSPKRSPETMSRIEQDILAGKSPVICVDKNDYQKGYLSDGKHRLIAYKRLGFKQIPILIREK